MPQCFYSNTVYIQKYADPGCTQWTGLGEFANLLTPPETKWKKFHTKQLPLSLDPVNHTPFCSPCPAPHPQQKHWGTLCSAFCCGLVYLLWSPYKWGQTISSVPLLASNEGQYSLYSDVLLHVLVLFSSLFPWCKMRNHLFIFIICRLVNFWFSPVVAWYR